MSQLQQRDLPELQDQSRIYCTRRLLADFPASARENTHSRKERSKLNATTGNLNAHRKDNLLVNSQLLITALH